MKPTDYDLIIVGGGMVGTSLALALKDQPLRIALIEAQQIQHDQQPNYDDRGIALAYGSQRIFETMGLWADFALHATPIHHIHVSDRGHFGVTRLSAQQQQVPALGQVILARAMGHQLNQALLKQQHIELICPAQLTALTQNKDNTQLEINGEQTLSCRLLVAADGQQSTVRKLLKLGAREQDYQQTAITANITPQRPHNNRAYERFTDSGPLALLPMSDNRCSLIWTVKTGEEQALLAMDDAQFLQTLQQRFGYRLGKLQRVGERHSHPLTLMEADQPVQQRIVLIGNAAHSLHPIAGQGFNLGLRDVTVLADLLADHVEDCGHARLLHQYKMWRAQDQQSVINSTNILVRLFSNNNPLLGHLRAAGLTVLDLLPPAKSWLATNSMGLGRKLPRLDRGIRL